jgi:hypothetical protein
VIYGPDGRGLFDPLPEDQEGIRYADLDPTLIALAKATSDPADAVRLVVHRTKREVMREINKPERSTLSCVEKRFGISKSLSGVVSIIASSAGVEGHLEPDIRDRPASRKPSSHSDRFKPL